MPTVLGLAGLSKNIPATVQGGIKTSRYTLAFYIDRKNKLKKVLFFDDWNDPYQMHNIAPETRKADYQALCCRLGELLKEIDDPLYKQLILNNLIKYRK